MRFSMRRTLHCGHHPGQHMPHHGARQLLLALGIDPASLSTVTGRTMAENADAVVAGTLDIAQVFEPFASRAVARGCAVWHAQADRGPTSYTAFYATRAILAEKRAAILDAVRDSGQIPPERFAAVVGRMDGSGSVTVSVAQHSVLNAQNPCGLAG